jgi:O-antigen/teichoic acid export membrane protein
VLSGRRGETGFQKESFLSVGRNTTYNLLGLVLPLALSMVTVPLYLKLVGPERYGVLAIAWLLLGYFGLFDLGLGRATSFRIASLKGAEPQARADTFWAALAVNVGMGLAGSVLLYVAGSVFFGHFFKVRESLRPEILASVPFLACAVPIATLTGTLSGAMQGREKFLETNVVSLISTTLFQLLPLAIAYWVGPNLILLLGAAIAARFTAIAVLAIRCYAEFCRGHARRFMRSEIGPLLKYGMWVNVTSLLGPLLFMVDRFSIGAVLGAVAVTIYTVPFQLAQRVQVLPGALTTALFPRLSSSAPEAQKELSGVVSRTVAALMGLPVLGAIFVIGPFLKIWVGSRIGPDSATVGQIVLIGFFFNSLAQISFVRLQASGRPSLVAKAILAEIPIYNVALFLVLRQFGFLGCAILFVVRCTADYLLLTWLADRRIPGWRMLCATMVVLSLGAAAAGRWPFTDWRLWASGAGLGSALATMGWFAIPPEMMARLRALPGIRTVVGLLPS